VDVKIKLRYVRWSVQFGSFYLLFPMLLPVFHCPNRLPWVLCDTCPVFWCPSKQLRGKIVPLIIGLTLATGRGFCGWVCPYGSLQDLFNRISRNFSGVGDYLIRDNPRIKYAAAGLAVIMVAHLFGWINLPLVDAIIPSVPAWVPYVLGGFLFASVFVSRLWCRFLCPLGAATSLFNRISLIKLKLSKKKCARCSQCKKSCIMVSGQKRVDPQSTDCMVCGECLGECPKGAISAGTRY